jgi:hypothetical protein
VVGTARRAPCVPAGAREEAAVTPLSRASGRPVDGPLAVSQGPSRRSRGAHLGAGVAVGAAEAREGTHFAAVVGAVQGAARTLLAVRIGAVGPERGGRADALVLGRRKMRPAPGRRGASMGVSRGGGVCGRGDLGGAGIDCWSGVISGLESRRACARRSGRLAAGWPTAAGGAAQGGGCSGGTDARAWAAASRRAGRAQRSQALTAHQLWATRPGHGSTCGRVAAQGPGFVGGSEQASAAADGAPLPASGAARASRVPRRMHWRRRCSEARRARERFCAGEARRHVSAPGLWGLPRSVRPAAAYLEVCHQIAFVAPKRHIQRRFADRGLPTSRAGGSGAGRGRGSVARASLKGAQPEHVRRLGARRARGLSRIVATAWASRGWG